MNRNEKSIENPTLPASATPAGSDRLLQLRPDPVLDDSVLAVDSVDFPDPKPSPAGWGSVHA
jgi:hypothetical protein